MKMEKEKSSWTATLFRYAEGQKAKLVISVILSVISVTSGLVPFYCMYRIICLFTDGIASSSSIIGWCIGALAAYIVKVVLFTLSTGISHNMDTMFLRDFVSVWQTDFSTHLSEMWKITP